MHCVGFRGESRQIQVGKILCLGQNYPEHAKEMRGAVPEAPVIFLKPSTALLHDGGTVLAPPATEELHHEVELVLLIGKEGRNIPSGDGLQYVGGYGVGLDMTMRDVQREAKKKGEPWSVAKGFDTSAPVSAFVRKETVRDPGNLLLSLKVNGTLRQHSSTGKMMFGIDRIIAYLSGIFTLEPGDLVFTGTPEGVGKVVAGDVLDAEIERVGTLHVSIG